MIVVLLFIALWQDGPIPTAPSAGPPTQKAAAAASDPGPTRLEDCNDPARRRPGEEAFTCASRVRTEQWMRSLQPDRNDIDWEFRAADRPDQDPASAADQACTEPANPPSSQAGFDCALRLARSREAGGRVGSLGFRVAPDGPEVPAWALADPAAWEARQCGASGDEACLRQARNRLAMARAGVAAEPPAPGGASGDGQNCRMVMRRSETGFGGSLSRVCGDEAAVQDLQGRLEVPAQPRPEPCDRPGSLETQDAWIARCRALPVR